MKTQNIFLYMAAATIMLSGCGGTALNKNQYVLDVSQKQTTKSERPLDASLEITVFAIDAQFSGRQIVYRTSDFKYVPDYYNEFFISPAMMVTQAARNWFADAGVFARVLEPGSGTVAGYVLNGSIVECYADIRDKAAPAAVLKIRVFLSKNENSSQVLVLTRTYDIRKPMKNIQAQSYIAAMSLCLQEFLQKLQSDLPKKPM